MASTDLGVVGSTTGAKLRTWDNLVSGEQQNTQHAVLVSPNEAKGYQLFTTYDDGMVSRVAANNTQWPPAGTATFSSPDSIPIETETDASGIGSSTVGLFAWDTSSIPDNAIIVRARVRLYLSGTTATGKAALRGEWYNWTGVGGDWTSNSRGGVTAFHEYNFKNWYAIDPLTEIFECVNLGSISKTGITRMRVHMTRDDKPATSGTVTVNVAGMNNGFDPVPRLDVWWVTPDSGAEISVLAAEPTREATGLVVKQIPSTSDNLSMIHRPNNPKEFGMSGIMLGAASPAANTEIALSPTNVMKEGVVFDDATTTTVFGPVPDGLVWHLKYAWAAAVAAGSTEHVTEYRIRAGPSATSLANPVIAAGVSAKMINHVAIAQLGHIHVNLIDGDGYYLPAGTYIEFTYKVNAASTAASEHNFCILATEFDPRAIVEPQN